MYPDKKVHFEHELLWIKLVLQTLFALMFQHTMRNVIVQPTRKTKYGIHARRCAVMQLYETRVFLGRTSLAA